MDSWSKLIGTGTTLLLIGIAVGLRLFMLRPYPKGDSGYLESPNSLHRAYIYELTDKGFFGTTERFYRFTIEMKPLDGKRIKVFEKDVPPSNIGVTIDLDKPEEIIKWSEDSVVATFHLGAVTFYGTVPFTR
jgi:hypothetical protein